MQPISPRNKPNLYKDTEPSSNIILSETCSLSSNSVHHRHINHDSAIIDHVASFPDVDRILRKRKLIRRHSKARRGNFYKNILKILFVGPLIIILISVYTTSSVYQYHNTSFSSNNELGTVPIEETNIVSLDKNKFVTKVHRDERPAFPRVTCFFHDMTGLEGKLHSYFSYDSSKNTMKNLRDSESNLNPEMNDSPSILNTTQSDCVPKKPWQTVFYPTCNKLHELDLAPSTDLLSPDSSNISTAELIGIGSWRMTWKLDNVVLKMARIQREFDAESFEQNRIDSIAMERLTFSPHVIHEYGFCGQSVVTEIATDIRSLIKRESLSNLDRLKFALNLANGLADIHGIDYYDGQNATLVHNDINAANIVQVNSTVRFNDFNIGVLLRWNQNHNRPCGFPALFFSSKTAQWRAPEEIRNETHITEKADVYSLGNIFFQFLTKREPWKWLEPGGRPTMEDVAVRKLNGTLPHFPIKYSRTKDPARKALFMATILSYTLDPEKRPRARDIANKMKRAVKLIEKKGSKVRTSHIKEIFSFVSKK